MKRFVAVVMALLLIVPAIAAAQPGDNGARFGLVQPEEDGGNRNSESGSGTAQPQQRTQNEGASGTLQAQQVRARNVTELHALIRQKTQALEQEMQNATPARRNVLKNQNQVRIAVHALLAAENRIGGIGPQVSAIAREFNNSVMATIQAEERIRERSWFKRLLLGGNVTAAEIIQRETERNRERIELLNRLIANCTSCDPEMRSLLQEQVQIMEQEQQRLRELAEQEDRDRGLLGWLLR